MCVRGCLRGGFVAGGLVRVYDLCRWVINVYDGVDSDDG